MRISIALAFVLFTAACGTDDVVPQDPIARIDLRTAFALPDVAAVGVAIDDTGARYVFEESAGLFRLDGESAVSVVAMSAMPDPGPTAPLKLPFTDVVAIAPHQFAVTAIGDGYILDTSAMTLTQKFCYLPEGEGGTPTANQQRTDALAFDPATAQLYAQPITTDAAGTFVSSQLAAYASSTGESTAWYFAPDELAATAMLALDGRLLLGQGSRLLAFDLSTGLTSEVDDLLRFGVLSIDGLAVDRTTGAIVVVDRLADEVIDLDRAELGL